MLKEWEKCLAVIINLWLFRKANTLLASQMIILLVRLSLFAPMGIGLLVLRKGRFPCVWICAVFFFSVPPISPFFFSSLVCVVNTRRYGVSSISFFSKNTIDFSWCAFISCSLFNKFANFVFFYFVGNRDCFEVIAIIFVWHAEMWAIEYWYFDL